MNRAKLRKSDHTYWEDGKKIPISVTQLLGKHNLSADYSGVPEAVLEKKSKRGELVHEEIEKYIKTGEMGFTAELYDFIDISKDLELTKIKSEKTYNNDFLAGTADIIATGKNGTILADIKTTAVAHKQAVRWQLSLLERLSGKIFDEFYLIHLGEKSKVIKLERIPKEEVDKLLDCERQGIPYTEKALEVGANEVMDLVTLEKVIYALKVEKEEAEKRAEAIREMFYNKMIEQGIEKFEAEGIIRINCIRPTTRESIDGTRLQKELPDIAREYTKISPVKGSLRITLLGDYNGTEN